MVQETKRWHQEYLGMHCNLQKAEILRKNISKKSYKLLFSLFSFVLIDIAHQSSQDTALDSETMAFLKLASSYSLCLFFMMWTAKCKPWYHNNGTHSLSLVRVWISEFCPKGRINLIKGSCHMHPLYSSISINI